MLLLASSSPYRLALLRQAGISCTPLAPDVDEAAIQASTPRRLAMARAHAKARSTWKLALKAGMPRDSLLVVGADQVVHMDGRVFGKPVDASAHLDMLRAFRGRSHALTTGVVILGEGRGRRFQVTSRVHMRADLSEEELVSYVNGGEGRGCAGGYQVEQRGILLFDRVEGDWTNIVGLPIPRLVTALRDLGHRPG